MMRQDTDWPNEPCLTCVRTRTKRPFSPNFLCPPGRRAGRPPGRCAAGNRTPPDPRGIPRIPERRFSRRPPRRRRGRTAHTGPPPVREGYPSGAALPPSAPASRACPPRRARRGGRRWRRTGHAPSRTRCAFLRAPMRRPVSSRLRGACSQHRESRWRRSWAVRRDGIAEQELPAAAVAGGRSTVGMSRRRKRWWDSSAGPTPRAPTAGDFGGGASFAAVTMPPHAPKIRPGATPLDPGGKEVTIHGISPHYRASVRATRKPR